jgi:hypothetical protein
MVRRIAKDAETLAVNGPADAAAVAAKLRE